MDGRFLAFVLLTNTASAFALLCFSDYMEPSVRRALTRVLSFLSAGVAGLALSMLLKSL